jgi:hypothetical protein
MRQGAQSCLRAAASLIAHPSPRIPHPSPSEETMRRNQTRYLRHGGAVHTVPAKGATWINRISDRVLSRHRTKADAIAAGRRYARRLQAEHFIHS